MQTLKLLSAGLLLAAAAMANATSYTANITCGDPAIAATNSTAPVDPKPDDPKKKPTDEDKKKFQSTIPEQYRPHEYETGAVLGFNATANPGSTSPRWFFPNPGFGPAFGATLYYPLADKYGFGVDALYSDCVFSGVSVINYPHTYLNKLGYIDLPIKAVYEPVKNLRVFIGAAFSFLVKNNSYLENVSLTETPGSVTNGNVRHIVPGFTYGIEYKIADVMLSGRITYGSQYENNIPPRSTVVGQLTVGYSFKVTHRRYNFEGKGKG